MKFNKQLSNGGLFLPSAALKISGFEDSGQVEIHALKNPSTLEVVDKLVKQDNCKSRSDYLETAAQFYAGYLSGEEATAYLPPALVAAMRGTVQDSENRIARLLFKLAVEINMMMNVLAAGMEISDEDLRQLRARAVREVKQTNGRINFKDAIDYQRGEE